MADAHSQHVRGDRAAGTGHAYECLCRARLMLALKPGESLSIYANQDAKVVRASGAIEYYQFKYAQKRVSLGVLDDEFFVRADSLLKDPNVSVYVCSNEQLTSGVRERLSDLQQTAGKRIASRVWSLDAEDPTHLLKKEISKVLAAEFPTSDVASVLRVSDIQSVIDKTLGLEAELELMSPFSIVAERVRRDSGLGGLYEILRGRVFGGRITTWPRRREQLTEQNSDDVDTYGAAAGLFEYNRVDRDIDLTLARRLDGWLARPTTEVWTISGASGSGRSWLLMHLADRISGPISVYWTGGTGSLPPEQLPAIADWERRPTVLFADDILIEEWVPYLAATLNGRQPFLLVAATTSPSDGLSLRDVLPASRLTEIALPAITPTKDAAALVRRFRDQGLSLRETRLLRTSTIRRAVRILRGRGSYAPQTSRLYSLWRSAAPEVQTWLSPLLLCTSMGIQIPLSVLHAHLRGKGIPFAPLPSFLDSVAVVRRRADDTFLSLEEPYVASRVLSLAERSSGASTVRDAMTQEAADLLNVIDPLNPVHREFTRGFVVRMRRHEAIAGKRVLTAAQRVLATVASHELTAGCALFWFQSLLDIGAPNSAKESLTRFFMEMKAQGANATVDLRLVVALYGIRSARRLLETTVGLAPQWSVSQWAQFFERLSVLPAPLARPVARNGVALMRRLDVDVAALIAIGSTGTYFVQAVEKHGRSEDREWALAQLDGVLQGLAGARDPEGPAAVRNRVASLIPKYLKLVERYLMQRRNGLSIEITKRILAAKGDEAKCENVFKEAIRAAEEMLHDPATGQQLENSLALSRLALETDDSLTRRANTWAALLPFARKWAVPADLAALFSLVRSELDNHTGSTEPMQTVYLTFGRELVRGGPVERGDFNRLLRPISQLPHSSLSFRLATLLGALAAKSGNAKLQEAGSDVVKAVALADCDNVVPALRTLIRALSDTNEDLGPAVRDELTAGVTRVRHELSIAIESWAAVRSIEWDVVTRARIAKWIAQRWLSREEAFEYLLPTLFALGSKDELAMARQTSASIAQLSDHELLICAWELKFGDKEAAEQALSRSINQYRDLKKGAHTSALHMAYTALEQSAGSSCGRAIWALCNALSMRGRLQLPHF